MNLGRLLTKDRIEPCISCVSASEMKRSVMICAMLEY